MYFKNTSRFLSVVTCFYLLGSLQIVQAGFFDELKSYGKNVVDQAVREADNKTKRTANGAENKTKDNQRSTQQPAKQTQVTQKVTSGSSNSLETIKAQLDKFEFQGVKLGMTENEAEKILLKKGFTLKKGDEILYKEEKGVIKGFAIGAEKPYHIIDSIFYTQTFPKGARLDKEIVAEKIKKKYGKPGTVNEAMNSINIVYTVNEADGIWFNIDDGRGHVPPSIKITARSLKITSYVADLKKKKKQEAMEAQQRAHRQKPMVDADF